MDQSLVSLALGAAAFFNQRFSYIIDISASFIFAGISGDFGWRTAARQTNNLALSVFTCAANSAITDDRISFKSLFAGYS